MFHKYISWLIEASLKSDEFSVGNMNLIVDLVKTVYPEGSPTQLFKIELKPSG